MSHDPKQELRLNAEQSSPLLANELSPAKLFFPCFIQLGNDFLGFLEKTFAR